MAGNSGSTTLLLDEFYLAYYWSLGLVRSSSLDRLPSLFHGDLYVHVLDQNGFLVQFALVFTIFGNFGYRIFGIFCFTDHYLT